MATTANSGEIEERGVKRPASLATAITVIGGMLVVGGQPVAGASFEVTDAGDAGPGTLRQAILDANATEGVADDITFSPTLAGSTITLTSGRLGISDDLTIVGLGEGQLTLTNATNDVLYLYNGASLNLSNITIDGSGNEGIAAGSSGDLIVSSITIADVDSDGIRFESPGSDLTIESSTFSGSGNSGVNIGQVDDVTMTDSVSRDNGDHGLYIDDTATGSVMVTGSNLSDNTEDGLYANRIDGDLTIIDSTIDENGDDGIDIFDVSGALTIDNTSVSDNDSHGVYLQDVGTDLTLSGATISDNGEQGLTIDDGVGGDVVVTDTTASNNDSSGLYFDNVAGDVTVSGTTATDNGNNGLYIEDIAGNVTIMTSVLSRNGETGAEIEPVGGNVTVTDTLFEENESSGLYIRDNIGGDVVIERVTAIDNENYGLMVHDVQGSVTISDSTSIGSFSHGIDLDDNAGDVTIERTTVSDSEDSAIDSTGATGELLIVNSTLTENGDAVTDPVIETDGAAPVRLVHSTISGNGRTGMTAPVIQVADAAVTVDHTIVSDNRDAAVFAASATGTVAVTNSLTPVGSGLGDSNVESDAPLLESLADNGGLTETLRPGAGSPAIDAGDPAIVGAPATDQRGELRVAGTIDIGSVELSGGSVSVADVTVAEDAGSATVTLTRSGGSDGAGSVQVTTSDGTATDGTDYTGVDETVPWADGESGDKTVEVAILDDAEVEGDETFVVTLADPTVVSIDDGEASVTITDDDIAEPVVVDAVSSLDPSRFVDTRDAGDTFDDLFEGEGKRAAGSEYVVQISGRGGVPDGASAAVLNVTAVAPEGAGFVTVHPCVDPLPNASSLNYTSGVNLANEIVAPLSDTGEICVFTSEAAHIVVDVVGFVGVDSPTTPVTPARYLDTRAAGETFDGDDQQGGRTSAGGQVSLRVTDRGDVPADAVAVIANVTAVGPEGTGFVTVHPCEPTPPNASSLNYVDGVNRANELIASVDGDGEICLFTSSATDLLVDIVGYVPAGSSLNVVGPARFLDTRDAGETVDGVAQAGGKRDGGSQLELQIGGRPGVPDGASAVVVNVTAVAPEATGFVTVHPCEAEVPNASSLNYVAGVNGANELIARLDADGKICLFTDQTTHLIVDVVAYLD